MTRPLNVEDLAAYGVDAVRGFLPALDPLERLPKQYAAWDELALQVPRLIDERLLRARVREMPALDPTALEGAALERAMLVLSVLGNAYVWQPDGPALHLPAVLAVPWRQIADRLGRPAIAAHASMVLANWRRREPGASLEPEDLDLLVTFRDLPDERWFFLVTAAIEARGGPAVMSMLAAQSAAGGGEVRSLEAALRELADILAGLDSLLRRMYERCEPAVFYREIRPWLTGWPEPGVCYEGVSTMPLRLIGGSAAQSSLIQAFDAALGVTHPSPSSGPFLAEMRRYMPVGHRRFLERLEAGASIPRFVASRPTERELVDAYDGAIEQLDRFRKSHLEMAARYITQQARADAEARGTGGTDFGAFLAAARRETQAMRGASPARE